MKKFHPAKSDVRLRLKGGYSISLNKRDCVYLHNSGLVEVGSYFSKEDVLYDYGQSLFVTTQSQFQNEELWRELKN